MAVLAKCRGCHLHRNGVGSVRLWQASGARDCGHFWRGAACEANRLLWPWVLEGAVPFITGAGAWRGAHMSENQQNGLDTVTEELNGFSWLVFISPRLLSGL